MSKVCCHRDVKRIRLIEKTKQDRMEHGAKKTGMNQCN